ncbi:hypothetical protein GJ496_008295 [Pomphorhynchus laevis]|nr:hypothetical protein GJ496_008295 [Pomphorhynchus laevis]
MKLVLVVLWIFEIISRMVFSYILSDQLSTKVNRNLDWEEFSSDTEFLTHLSELRQLQKIKLTSVCPMNSIPFEGACYRFSTVKMTWDQAESACTNWRNSSLAIINSMRELNFIANQIRNKTHPVDSYLFVGLRDFDGYLSWLNGIPLAQSELSIIYEPYRPRRFRCGMLLVFKDGEKAIEQRSCDFDSNRFVCKYVLDSCFNNSKCSPGGTCFNYGNSYVCRCRFMYDGFHCQQWSSAAIQSMLSGILAILGLMVWCVISFDFNRRILALKHVYRTLCGT